MGTMLLFDRAEPNGYPEAGSPWISAGTLAERLRYTQALLIANGQSGHADAGPRIPGRHSGSVNSQSAAHLSSLGTPSAHPRGRIVAS